MRTVHKFALGGGTVCGKPGVASCSGTVVTCPECERLTRKPSRAEMLAALERAVAEMKAKRVPA